MDINHAAAAVVEVERIIRAPLPTIWNLQVDIDAWPTWNRHVARSRLHGPIGVGQVFEWETEGLAITSTVRAYDPMRRLGWTGESRGIEAAHLWTFTERSPASVLVRTEESWDGDAVRLDIPGMRAALEGSLQAWLSALEYAAEHGE